MRNFKPRTDELCYLFCEDVKTRRRDIRRAERDIFAVREMIYRTRTHFILVFVRRNLARNGVVSLSAALKTRNIARARFVERYLRLRRLRRYPRREKRLNECRHKLALGIASQLQKRLDNGCKIRNASVLIRSFRVVNMQNVRKSRSLAENGYPLPRRRL